MNRIHLNHGLMTSSMHVFATTLLVIGSLLSGALFLYNQQLSSKAESLQMDIQRYTQSDSKRHAQRGLTKINAKENAGKHDETIAVNAAIKEIVLPWPSLFKTLESAGSADVQLLALEPNAKQRSLHIKAAALNAKSMMRYVDALARQTMLKQVVLLSQESADISGNKAIRFEIGAVWNI